MLLSANRKPSFITLGNSRTGNHSIVCWRGGMQEERMQNVFFFVLFFFIKSSKKNF